MVAPRQRVCFPYVGNATDLRPAQGAVPEVARSAHGAGTRCSRGAARATRAQAMGAGHWGGSLMRETIGSVPHRLAGLALPLGGIVFGVLVSHASGDPKSVWQ